MDALLQSVTHSVARDFRELIHAARLDAHNDDALIELEPPNYTPWWRLPLGFGSLAAAAMLFVFAAGVQTGVQQGVVSGQRHAGKVVKAKTHRRALRPKPMPAPPDRLYY